MFIGHLMKNLHTYLKDELAYYRLVQSLENAVIRRPFYVISPERLKIGKNILIQRHCLFHCGGLPWSFGKGGITIGDGCVFSENNLMYGAGEIEIGDQTMMGPLVMIFSSRGNYSIEYAKLPKEVHQFGKVKIGSYVRVYSNVVIGPGVTIGDGVIIGSGSVVSQDIPEWSFAVGNPARVIRKRDHDIPLADRKNDTKI